MDAYLAQFPKEWRAFRGQDPDISKAERERARIMKREEKARAQAEARARRAGAAAETKKWRAALRRRFERSAEWQELRARVFVRDGKVCRRCGSLERLQVDHIKPKSKHPELALCMENLQVLCWPCNKAKAAN